MGTPSTVMLIEWDVRDKTTNLVTTQYWATDPGYRTGPSDTPANTAYQPRVSSAGSIGRFIFGDGKTGGGSSVSVGRIRLKNADGGLDSFVADDWGTDGAAVRIYLGNTDMARASFTLIARAVSEYAEGIIDLGDKDPQATIDIVIADPMSLFDKPFQTVKYLGTNVGPAGFEGTAEDLKGAVKPGGYGDYFNASAKAANGSLLAYQFNDRQTERVGAVYDNGVALSDDGDVATEASFISFTPASGSYITCLNLGLLKLGASPAGLITVDVSTGGSQVASGFAGEWNNRETIRFPTLGLAAESTRVLGSFWLNLASYITNDPTGAMPIFRTSTSTFALHVGSDGMSVAAKRKRLIFRLAGDSDNLVSAATILTGTWQHVAFSFDIAAQNFQVAIDGVIQSAVATGSLASLPAVGATFGFNGTSARAVSVGGDYTPSSTENLLKGCLAEIYLAPDQWLDISDPVSIRAFRTASGFPANIGNYGQGGTGVVPSIYVKGYGAQLLQNLGSGSTPTSSTLPAQCATSPYATASQSSFVSSTAGQLIQQIVQHRAGLTTSDIASAEFTQLDTDAPETVGVYVENERTIRDVLDEVANSVGAWYAWKRDGTLMAGKFDLPGTDYTYRFTSTNILSLKAVTTTDEGKGVPAYSVVLNYYKNNTVQGTGVAGSVSALRRAFLESEFRKLNNPDNTVLAKHPKAPELEFESLISDASEALGFHNNRQRIYGVKRQRFNVEVAMDATSLAVELGDDVLLTYDRFGLSSGRDFTVIGIDYQNDRKIVEFDIWGGVQNSFSGTAAGSSSATATITDIVMALGATAWWRADNTTLVSTAVSALLNKISGGPDLVQATSGARPTIVASEPTINNQPYVDFDGTTDFLKAATGAFAVFGSLGDYTMFVVAKWDALPGVNGESYVYTVGNYNVSLGGASATQVTASQNKSGGGTDDLSQNVSTATWYGIQVRRGSSEFSFRRRGTVVTLAPGTATALATDTIYVGADAGEFYTFDGGVAEIIVFPTELSDDNCALVRAYLAARYGISWDPPTIDRSVQGGTLRSLQGGGTRGVFDTNG